MYFYVGGRFIAPVYGTNICLISYDQGITFEEKILPGTGRWLRGAYGYNTIVLVGGYSGAPSADAEFQIIYSNDLGETWQVASYPGVRVGWINIIFGDGKFIIMPPGNTAIAVDFLVSYNGIDWEIKQIPPYMTTYYMVYGNGIIITTNNSNTIWRSEDGLMWSSIIVPNVQFRQIIYGGINPNPKIGRYIYIFPINPYQILNMILIINNLEYIRYYNTSNHLEQIIIRVIIIQLHKPYKVQEYTTITNQYFLG